MLDFSVIGLGSVGWAVVHGLHSQGFSYAGYDIVGKHDWNNILESKVAFVCSSTPSGPNGRLDCSSVKNILERLDKDGYQGVVVVKSTVSVGFMDKAKGTFPHLRLVYMPEFLRERSCYSWFLKPDRLAISGEKQDAEEALSLFRWVPEDKILHTSHISAEIGKLAHNSYIATKVSFTNEMERICKENGANPQEAMEIVWRDRRVNCSDHLTPGLGPFGGKCVVKDMNELLVASNSPLLETVRQVNGMTKASETIPIYSEVAIIIPTSHGIDFLRRSLNSLANQTYMPKKAVVVSDQSNPNNSEISELVASYKNRLGIDHIMNTHAQNVSGAINSGLEHLDRGNYLDNNMFVGLLDDDDWWEPRYLENCVKFSYEYESDWIVPGLIRYDEKNPLGSKQPIPHVLSVSDFLVGNPNVQGSNLFVRAKNFKEVGRYDETLPSTTDRDICLRLLQKGTKYTILFNHLVHHDAFARSDRLSQPGSNRKREGLKAFYEKYSELMNGEQKAIFKARAKELFQIDLPEEGV